MVPSHPLPLSFHAEFASVLNEHDDDHHAKLLAAVLKAVEPKDRAAQLWAQSGLSLGQFLKPGASAEDFVKKNVSCL